MVKTWKTSLSDNPGIRHEQCLRDEDIANGREIDDQCIATTGSTFQWKDITTESLLWLNIFHWKDITTESLLWLNISMGPKTICSVAMDVIRLVALAENLFF